MRIEFFFDFSCPFAHVAQARIDELAARAGAELVWKPMLLGGVMRALGSDKTTDAESEAKKRHHALDRLRWAELRGLPMAPAPHHPQKTVRALRAVLAVAEARRPALIHALFDAYWARGEVLEEQATIARALDLAGVTGDAAAAALAANDDAAIKEDLKRRTDEAVARGVFGAPTFFVTGPDGQERFFWGQDRMDQVEAVLRGWDPTGGVRPAGDHPVHPGSPPTGAGAGAGATIHFWYDFSSPFSYLAATEVERVAAFAGARVVWRPMLLGAVFRDIGMANVPLFAMSEAKRRAMMVDLQGWASWWGVPFRWPSKFPQKTVTALRLALLGGDRIGEVSLALFRAIWKDGRNLEDDAVCADVLSSLGLDAAAQLAATQAPATKQALIDSTSEAVKSGVFGAPTFVVKRAGQEDRLFWGQDRLGLVARAALGVAVPSR